MVSQNSNSDSCIARFNTLASVKPGTRRSFTARYSLAVRDCLRDEFGLVREGLLDRTTHHTVMILWKSKETLKGRGAGHAIHKIVGEQVLALHLEQLKMVDEIDKQIELLRQKVTEIKSTWKI